jgi:SAM-dependent methyltransferase
VVEHDARGPDAILAEARRVLAPDGVLVVSVPYVNGVRRLTGFWIRRRQRALAGRGAAFYQYAFSRRELRLALERHGFQPLSASPYGPGYYLGKLLPRPLRRAGRAGTPAATPAPGASAPPGRRTLRTSIVRLTRHLLHSEPSLRLFGHMLLVVARRGDRASLDAGARPSDDRRVPTGEA